jgi:hypothetical protein
MAQRPLWEWGVYLVEDVLSPGSLARVVPAVLGDFVPNIVHRPMALMRVAEFIRTADLLDEAVAVAEKGIPVVPVWSDRDVLVPRGSHVAVCKATGAPGVVVPGNHTWLIADPELFVDVALRSLAEVGVLCEMGSVLRRRASARRKPRNAAGRSTA